VLAALETQLHSAGVGEGRVLDVGCGDGTFAARLAGLGTRVTGLDPAPAALVRAREAHPDIDWVAPGEEGRLPFADASFDLVTCVSVLQHVPDTQSLLSEMRRVLGADGLVAIAVPFHGRLKNVLVSLGAFERHFDPLEPVLRFYTARSLRTLLEDFGFERVEVGVRGGAPFLRETLMGVGRRAGL
jgi:2-polyprenyl-6-hydroxyphenyl methylase/3-demethylubiquinone-9 3-methyltransferase